MGPTGLSGVHHKWSLHLRMMARFLWTLHLQSWLPPLHSLSHVIQSGMVPWKVICKLIPVTRALARPGWRVCLWGLRMGWQLSLTGMERNTWRPPNCTSPPSLSSNLPLIWGGRSDIKFQGLKIPPTRTSTSLLIFSQVESLTLQGKIPKPSNYPLDT